MDSTREIPMRRAAKPPWTPRDTAVLAGFHHIASFLLWAGVGAAVFALGRGGLLSLWFRATERTSPDAPMSVGLLIACIAATVIACLFDAMLDRYRGGGLVVPTFTLIAVWALGLGLGDLHRIVVGYGPRPSGPGAVDSWTAMWHLCLPALAATALGLCNLAIWGPVRGMVRFVSDPTRGNTRPLTAKDLPAQPSLSPSAGSASGRAHGDNGPVAGSTAGDSGTAAGRKEAAPEAAPAKCERTPVAAGLRTLCSLAWPAGLTVAAIASTAAGAGVFWKSEGESRASESTVLATLAGKRVAVVPYAQGSFTMAHERLAAIDLATGTRVWDVPISDDPDHRVDPRVLAVGKTYVYLATAQGLHILHSDTGLRVGPGIALPAEASPLVQSRSGLGWDPKTASAVALTTTGEILRIPLDTLRAQRAEADVVKRWDDHLGNLPTGGGDPYHSSGDTGGVDVANGREEGTPISNGRGAWAGEAFGIRLEAVDRALYLQARQGKRWRVVATVTGVERVVGALEDPVGKRVVLVANGDDDKDVIIVATRTGYSSVTVGDRGVLGTRAPLPGRFGELLG